MDNRIKWAGAAMAAGGLLMFISMAPIFAIVPDDMAFPPETTQDLVRLVGVAAGRWQLSHLLGLLAMIMFAVAYGWHSIFLMRHGWKRIGIALAITATLAFGLFGIALVIDGFVVPATVDSYVSANAVQTTTLEQVAGSHQPDAPRLWLRH